MHTFESETITRAPGNLASSGKFYKQKLDTRRLRVVLCPARWAELEPHWNALEASNPDSSFFLSGTWTAAWLEAFSETLKPEALLFELAGRVVGACLLVPASERRGPFRVRRLYVNTSGEESLDRSAMEFNGILCIPGFEKDVVLEFKAEIRRRKWDECVIEGCSEGAVLDSVRQGGVKTCTSSTHMRAAPYVDLARLRREGTDYEETLSTNTRSQIRRSIRMYEKRGGIEVERAGDCARAGAHFSELIGLHQRRWEKRGEPGAFASERKTAFHRALIDRGVAIGTVDLLRITAGGSTIGLLYTFVYRRKVYFYQSGLAYESHAHLKPGLVTHFLAIAHYHREGVDEYDFMAGDMRYKCSLATDSRPLYWVTFTRLTARMAGIELLRVARRRLRRAMVGSPAKRSAS